MGGDVAAAEKVARSFNETYVPDELLHYLRYLTDKPSKNVMALKPQVIQTKDKTTLCVWHK
jgi:hypothetical protein